jgi:hypothetical protein
MLRLLHFSFNGDIHWICFYYKHQSHPFSLKVVFHLQTTYELRFGEGFFEYFESWNFSSENTNIGVPMFMFDIRMINMSSECEYD